MTQRLEDHDILLEVLYEIRARQIDSLGGLEARVLERLAPSRGVAGAGGAATATSSAGAGLDGNSPAPSEPVLDEEQRAIIESRADLRLLVNAPPGTGKTFVSCRRIEWLLNEGIAASRILVLSFTRTAVSEIQSRLIELEERFADARGVAVTTLDQRAWRLVHGLQGTGFDILARGHARSIEEALKLLRSGDPSVLQPIQKLRHVLIDEAQDIVAERAEFLVELIGRLSPECGVTVLADDAQAIYDFAARDKSEAQRKTLPERLRRLSSWHFEERTLGTVHRTTTAALKFFCTETRNQLLAGLRERTPGLVAFIREQIESSGESMSDDLSRLEGNDDALVLFRTRFEVLRTSRSLYRDGIRHRVRMSRLPTCAHPWLALALSQETEGFVSRTTFSARWTSVMRTLGTLAPAEEDAWAILEDLAGDGGRIDLTALRAVLSHGRAPAELCMADLGVEGPVISTIHASKGREAGSAYLYLPTSEPDENENEEEEARVLFVGATRGRRKLYVGRRGPTYDTSVGGTKRRVQSPQARRDFGSVLEVGLQGDLVEHSPVSIHLHVSVNEAQQAQDRLSRLALERDTAGNFRVRRGSHAQFVIQDSRAAGGPPLGILAPQFMDDLRELAKRADCAYSLMLPSHLEDFPVLGVCTMVLAPDSPDEDELHLPWRKSGFWLAPIVVGLVDVSFRER